MLRAVCGYVIGRREKWEKRKNQVPRFVCLSEASSQQAFHFVVAEEKGTGPKTRRYIPGREHRLPPEVPLLLLQRGHFDYEAVFYVVF